MSSQRITRVSFSKMTSSEVERPRITTKEEFEKNPDLKQEDLDELREWLTTQPHLPHVPDEMLILFHHSCYYKLHATKECIETYYTIRSNTPDLFANRDVKEERLAKAIAAMHFSLSPVPDENGNTVVYHTLREYEPSKFIQPEQMKVFFMMLDMQMAETGTQPGLVIVMDLQGVRLSHLTRVHFASLKKFFVYIQEGNPIRLKTIHLINVVSFIDKIMALVRPLMKKEFFELLQFHTRGMDEFYEQVPMKCLPKEVGGTLDAIEQLTAEHIEKLSDYAEFYLKDAKTNRIDESKRIKGKKSKQSKTPDIAFEKLDID